LPWRGTSLSAGQAAARLQKGCGNSFWFCLSHHSVEREARKLSKVDLSTQCGGTGEVLRQLKSSIGKKVTRKKKKKKKKERNRSLINKIPYNFKFFNAGA